MKAVGYTRVSTSEQAQSGFSLETQEEKIRAYADLFDIEITEILSDPGISAKDLNRPGVQRLLALLDEGGVEGVVVMKLDRLTRSLHDLTEMLESYFTKDIALLSVSEQFDTRTAAGRMVVHMMIVVSQWEREVIAERVKSIMAHKKSEGHRVGTIPFGFKLAEDGLHSSSREQQGLCKGCKGCRTLIEDAEEQKALRRIRWLRSRGFSYRRIAQRLEAAGFPSRGKRWYAMTVKRIFDDIEGRI